MRSQLLRDFEEGNSNKLLDLFDDYCIDINYLKSLYDHPSRGYHNWEHIDEVILAIEDEKIEDNTTLQVQLIAALYHDAVYDSHSSQNEIESAEMVDEVAINDDLKQRIKDIILFTQYKRKPENEDERIFLNADMSIFSGNATPYQKVQFEKGVMFEYGWVPLSTYIEKRCEVLYAIQKMYGFSTSWHINYLQTKRWNIGVYAGSFYPMHIGHMDILNQARKIFDKVIIVKSSDDRVQRKTKFEWKPEFGALNPCLDNFETYQVESLITENLNHIKKMYGSATLIRGLRNGSDLQYEQNYLQTLREIDPSVQFVTFLSRPEYAHVSSSMIRELLSIDPKLGKRYYQF